MSLLEVRQIGKKEGGKTVLTDISFTQQRFQHIAIAGSTGSGKTTLLRIIAGLTAPTEGDVCFEEEHIPGPDEKLIPGHPSIAYLSQHFELRNHYHVEELLEMNNHLSIEDAMTLCRLCRIEHLLGRWTHQLSGGEKQRIALACLLVGAPKLLLLDEPYSNLDVIHKNILKTVLKEVSEHLQMTLILVAHDPSDVLPWADEIIVLREGAMVQKASSRSIYREPVDEYVAALFGKYNRLTPALYRELSAIEGKGAVQPDSFLRPEDFKISPVNGAGVLARVLKADFMGAYYELEVSAAGTLFTLYSEACFNKNDSVNVSLR